MTLTKFGSYSFLLIGLILIISCDTPSSNDTILPIENLQSFPIPKKSTLPNRTGINKNAPILDSLYTLQTIRTIPFPTDNIPLSLALQNQLKLLKLRKQSKQQQIGNLTVHLDQLKMLNEQLVYWQNERTATINESFDAYKIRGKDGKGNVYFTGYFTPVIKVDSVISAEYPYPIFNKPKKGIWKGTLPTREQIDGNNVLNGMNLELAYAHSLADIYYMQLQGSGIIEYTDGRQEYLSFTGTNKHKYKSIETRIIKSKELKISDISMAGMKRFFQQFPELEKEILFTNPSYVFFDRKKTIPHGAGHVPLTADYSIAVDPKYIPLGSTLLAAIPQVDEDNNFSHHEFRFVVAQDIGGAIRGSGHVDVYCGVGEEGQKKAMAFHQYGSLWLLLPKQEEQHKKTISSL